jgi:hypothetical protein
MLRGAAQTLDRGTHQAVAVSLARDFERYARTNIAFIRLAMIHSMLRRIAASPSARIQASRIGYELSS